MSESVLEGVGFRGREFAACVVQCVREWGGGECSNALLVPMLQCSSIFNAPMLYCFNALLLQCFNALLASMPYCFSVSMPQCSLASMLSCFNSSMWSLEFVGISRTINKWDLESGIWDLQFRRLVWCHMTDMPQSRSGVWVVRLKQAFGM